MVVDLHKSGEREKEYEKLAKYESSSIPDNRNCIVGWMHKHRVDEHSTGGSKHTNPTDNLYDGDRNSNPNGDNCTRTDNWCLEV